MSIPVRTIETCIYPILHEREYCHVLLRLARTGQNRGKWVPIGGIVDEGEAARDSAMAQTSHLDLGSHELDFCGLVTETSTEHWTVVLVLFKLDMVRKVTPSPDEAAEEYRWFPVGDLPSLPMPQSDSRFNYEIMFVDGGFYEARMRFGEGGKLYQTLVPLWMYLIDRRLLAPTSCN